MSLAVLLALAATAADPTVKVGEEQVPDPHRWLEKEDVELVEAWGRSRDADARKWAREEGHLDVVSRWLEAFVPSEERRTRVDHRDGVSLWRVVKRADPMVTDEGAEAWEHRLYVQGPDQQAPGDPVDDRYDQLVCASQLAPGGRYAVIGRLALEADDEAEEGELERCHLRLFDRTTRSSRDLFAARDVRVSWRPDGVALMIAHAVRGKAVLTEVTREGQATQRDFRDRRALDRLWWLPDGRLLGLSLRTAWNRPRLDDTRVFLGPPDALEQVGKKGVGRATLVGVHGEEVLVRTDGRTTGYEVVRVDPEEPAPERWRSLVAERPGMDLVWARRHGDSLLTVWSRDGLQILEQQPVDGGPSEVVDLGLATHVAAWRTLEEQAVVEARAPGSHRWWTRSPDGTLTELAGSTVRDDVRFAAAQAAGADGAVVPLTLLHRTGPAPGEEGWDPQTPVWMRVYGGFGHGQALVLDRAGELWLAAGGMIVVAHVRGGRERGEAWHEGATGLNLSATFDDTVAAARWLVAQGWTSEGRIALTGSSNGGLTVAAAVARAPELFGAAWGHAGVYDLLRGPAMGRWWPDEYGTLADPEQARVLREESPVHREVSRLPPLLLTTGARDRVVAPGHSYKLQAAWERAEGGPVLLRVDPFGSHGGRPADDGVMLHASQALEAQAYTLAFLFRALALPVPDLPGAASPASPTAPVEEEEG